MTATASILLVVAALLRPVAGFADEKDEVTIEIHARVPASTPPGAHVHLAGNLAPLGRWSPTGIELARGEDGIFHGRFQAPRGSHVECKLTLGSWSLVEKGAKGEEVPNRHFVAGESPIVDLSVAAWADGTPPPPKRSTATGDLRRHERFASKILGNDRTIAVWLPSTHERNREARFPVLYLQDGQNLFDEREAAFGGEWRADETAGKLIDAGAIEPVIIVGIENTPARIEEYTPVGDDSMKELGKRGGRGDRYVRFLLEEVKPFIDRTYRTRPGRESTVIGGSSLGGLIALHAVRTHPEVFGGCAALSPALWWGDREILRGWEGFAARGKGTRFWIDAGSREGSPGRWKDGPPPVVADARALARILAETALVPPSGVRLLEVDGGEHNEAAWAARFDRVLLFLLGSQQKP